MHPFSLPIRQVTGSLESLRDFVDVLDTFLTEQQKQSAKANDSLFVPLILAFGKATRASGSTAGPDIAPEVLEKLKEKYPLIGQIDVQESDGGYVLTAPAPEGYDVRAAVQDVLAVRTRTRTLYGSALLNLTGSIELFFARLLHQFFTVHPEAIGTKDKVFSFEDLSRFDSIADARAHYILDRIESLLRGPLSDWLKFAREQMKLSMGYLKDDIHRLDESFQRRNVIVHNGGIVNSIFLSRVHADVRKGVKLGDDVTPSRAYLNEIIDLWERSSILIAAELWKRAAPDDEQRAELLADISYRHLLSARWTISAAISEFLIRDKSMPEAVHLDAQLNLWQCMKRMDRWDEVKDDVAAFDIGAKSVRYQLPILALREDANEFFSLLPRALKSGELTKDELRDWPIFADMRSDTRFLKAVPKRKARRPRRGAAKVARKLGRQRP